MEYKTLYTLPFTSADGRRYCVEVEREGYTGEPSELSGQVSPFTVNIDDADGFMYAPSRLSTATLSVFGADALSGLFATDYRAHRVTLLCDGTPVWCGFVTPELYTQDYRHERFPLDVECQSAMSVLAHVDYCQRDPDRRDFISLWDLLRLCVQESRGRYTAVYVPYAYTSSPEAIAWQNVLEKMSVSEQNFFDEDDKPMKLSEVLDEVMKLFGWTCADWCGELWFIDIDIDNDPARYFRYDAAMQEYTRAEASRLAVQQVGFRGSAHAKDILPGYNKVTVRCSNYPVGDALPDTDFDKMKKTREEYNGVIGTTDKKEHVVYMRTKPEDNVQMLRYSYDTKTGELSPLGIDEEVSGPAHEVGAFPQKYETLDVSPSGGYKQTEHSYSERVYIPIASILTDSSGTPYRSYLYYKGKGEVPIITIKGKASTFQSGAFSIEFKLKVHKVMNPSNGEALASYDFHFQFRIGSNYFHGKSDGSYIWNGDKSRDPDYPNALEMDWQGEAMGGTGALSTFHGTYSLITSRRLDDGYDGLSGYLVRIPEDRALYGDWELVLFAPTMDGVLNESFESMELENFKIGYKKADKDKDEDADRTYENVVNEDYINELDEIELKISSYNDDGACYSKVMVFDYYLTDNLYSLALGQSVRPEEYLIRRIVSRYSATKTKLTQVLKNGAISPATVLTDRHAEGKEFLPVGGTIDYRANCFTCIMIEL